MSYFSVILSGGLLALWIILPFLIIFIFGFFWFLFKKTSLKEPEKTTHLYGNFKNHLNSLVFNRKEKAKHFSYTISQEERKRKSEHTIIFERGIRFEKKVKEIFMQHLSDKEGILFEYQYQIKTSKRKGIIDFLILWKDRNKKERGIIIECKYQDSEENYDHLPRQISKAIDQLFDYSKILKIEKPNLSVDLLLIVINFNISGSPFWFYKDVVCINFRMIDIFLNFLFKYLEQNWENIHEKLREHLRDLNFDKREKSRHLMYFSDERAEENFQKRVEKIFRNYPFDQQGLSFESQYRMDVSEINVNTDFCISWRNKKQKENLILIDCKYVKNHKEENDIFEQRKVLWESTKKLNFCYKILKTSKPEIEVKLLLIIVNFNIPNSSNQPNPYFFDENAVWMNFRMIDIFMEFLFKHLGELNGKKNFFIEETQQKRGVSQLSI